MLGDQLHRVISAKSLIQSTNHPAEDINPMGRRINSQRCCNTASKCLVCNKTLSDIQRTRKE